MSPVALKILVVDDIKDSRDISNQVTDRHSHREATGKIRQKLGWIIYIFP